MAQAVDETEWKTGAAAVAAAAPAAAAGGSRTDAAEEEKEMRDVGQDAEAQAQRLQHEEEVAVVNSAVV